MAKPRKDAQAAQAAEEVVYIESADELQQALSRLYAEAGTAPEEIDAMAHVYLVEPDGKEPKVWKGSAAQYDLDKLAREHGSGDYRLKVYVKDETGQFRLKMNNVFPYRLSAEADARLRAIRKGEVPVSGQPANGATQLTAGDVTRIVQEAMRASQTVQPSVDPMTMLKQVTDMVRNLLPQSAGGNGGMREVLDMSRNLLVLMKDLRGGEESGSVSEKPSDRAMARGIDLVARMMEKHMDGGAQPPRNGEQRQTPQEGEPVQLTAEEREQLEDIQMALRFTVHAAKNNVDPAAFADQWYDEVPLPMIADMMTNPQWFDVIAANAPAATQHKEWFTKLREELIGIAVKEKHLTPDGKIVEDQADGGADKGTGTGAAATEQ